MFSLEIRKKPYVVATWFGILRKWKNQRFDEYFFQMGCSVFGKQYSHLMFHHKSDRYFCEVYHLSNFTFNYPLQRSLQNITQQIYFIKGADHHRIPMFPIKFMGWMDLPKVMAMLWAKSMIFSVVLDAGVQQFSKYALFSLTFRNLAEIIDN